MEREEYMRRLQELAENISELETRETEVRSADAALAEAKSRIRNRKGRFDEQNREAFVLEKIGPEPKEPSKKLGIATLASITGGKEYEEQLAAYKKRRSAVEKLYEETYYETRHRLEQQDREERQAGIEKAKEQVRAAYEKRNVARVKVELDELVSPELRNRADVAALLRYLEYGRADDMKEAQNLLAEEKHRQRMEAMAEEMLRLTKETAALAGAAFAAADEARTIAEQAAEDAQRRPKSFFDED